MSGHSRDVLVRALVVEDDQGIAEFVQLGLRYEGFDVRTATDGLEGLRTAEQWHPDVVVLDLMLPGLGGLEVCRRLRALGNPAIVILTARDSLEDRVQGLETGADDYVVKPFAFVELVARIRSVLRRRANQAETSLQFEGLELNRASRRVTRDGRTIMLTPREFDLLQLLLEQPHRVYPKQAILERVWGFDFAGDDNIVEVYVRYLRHKINQEGALPLIRTVRGVGYALRRELTRDWVRRGTALVWACN